MRACLPPCRVKAIDSELALQRGDCDKLRTARGFLYGAILSSALWIIIGLLAWRMIA